MVGVGGNPKFQDQEFIAYSLEPPSFTFLGCCNEPCKLMPVNTLTLWCKELQVVLQLPCNEWYSH